MFDNYFTSVPPVGDSVPAAAALQAAQCLQQPGDGTETSPPARAWTVRRVRDH